uniref:Uncharacterized protein n=1 Tax=Haplochromis burtoni TaxID=8153 RepID=A0A3Q2WE34_HAPBU
MLRPQPSTQGTRSPSPLPRRPSPPHGPQIQGSPSHSLLQRMLDYPDDDCVRYFVLGTLTAVLALFVNLVYPLLYKATWS